MKEIYKRFFRELLDHSNDLTSYLDGLYNGDQYTNSDLNEIFGVLSKEGVVSYLSADNKIYALSITFEGKHYFDNEQETSDIRLYELINNIDEIELLFHQVPGVSLSPACDVIYDIQEYQDWIMEVRLELQSIYDRLHDHFIWETLRVCDKKMNGYDDKKIFSEIKARLYAIKRNIRKYYPENNQGSVVVGKGDNMMTKVEAPSYQDKELSEYDVFISHANSDKADLIDDLYSSLNKLGINIFYDKASLEWGDNWKQRILEGTKKAEFAIIVISENFFGREWTEIELVEFLNRQNQNGQKLILPILHNITIAQLKSKYPTIADIQAINSKEHSCDDIALLFARQLIRKLKNT